MSGFLLGVPGRLKTLLDRLTADRASRLDEITSTRMARLNADISSRAPASDVTTLLDRLTATRAGYLDAPISGIGGGSVIKSVQRGTGSMNNSTNSVSVTISAVNTGKAFAIVEGILSSGVTRDALITDLRGATVRGVLNATSLTVARGASQETLLYSWQVIEYE
jgi:hypothetical protein